MRSVRNLLFSALVLGCALKSPLPVQPRVEQVMVEHLDSSTEQSTPIPTVPEPQRPPPNRVMASRRILIVGDSEACAVNYVVKDVVKKLNDAAGVPRDEVVVDCKGGTTVQYWGIQGNLRAAFSRHESPDTVLVFLGTNHYWQQTTPPVDDILEVIDETRVDCLWVGNTAVHGKHWKINGLLRDAVTPTCRYFDTEAANIPLADGVHPDGSGATKWIKAIWPLIPPKYEEEND